MKKIGTADIIWKEFDNFVKTEKEHSMKKEPGWYVSVRWSVPREIQDILWSMYTKTGEGKDADGCGCPLGEISGFKLDSIRQHQDYLDSMGLSWDLLYLLDGIAVLQSGSLMIGLPDSTVFCKEYTDLDTCPELMGKYPLVSKNSASRKEVASGIRTGKTEAGTGSKVCGKDTAYSGEKERNGRADGSVKQPDVCPGYRALWHPVYDGRNRSVCPAGQRIGSRRKSPSGIFPKDPFPG